MLIEYAPPFPRRADFRKVEAILGNDSKTEALREIAGMRHGPDCPGYGGHLLRFKCTYHVRVAKNVLGIP